MNLSELILERKIADIKIGDDLGNTSSLELISEQEGDIPSLQGLYIDDLFFEITTMDNIVIGIQFDFRYEMATSTKLEVGNMEIILDEDTSVQELTGYFEKLDLVFEIIESELEPKNIRLKKSKMNFYFDNENRLLKLASHD